MLNDAFMTRMHTGYGKRGPLKFLYLPFVQYDKEPEKPRVNYTARH